MAVLIVAALVWIGVHVGIAGTALRTAAVRRIGEGAFRGVYSLLSVGAIAFLIGSWKDAPYIGLWSLPDDFRVVLAAIMLVAFLLFAGSVTVRNPTTVGGDAFASAEPRGMLRVTRHPMLWSFTLWSAVHMIANGDVAAVLFFGAFGVTSLVGMPSIDAKIARRDPAGWRALSGRTSILPFGAIIAGRNRFQLREIGLPVLAIGLGLWVLLLWAHPKIFGVYALPY